MSLAWTRRWFSVEGISTGSTKATRRNAPAKDTKEKDKGKAPSASNQKLETSKEKEKDKERPKDKDHEEPKAPGGDPEKALQMLIDTADAMLEERNGEDAVWGSMIKQALRRRHPGFNERFHGFRTFNTLLEAARDRGLMELKLDEKSGNYAVSKLRLNEASSEAE